MRKIRCGLVVLGLLSCMVLPAKAEVSVSIGIGLPHVSIGINLPFYPELVRVPGYPVYYAPRIHANYFFYDGMYWVYQDDQWYASDWFDGPWWYVEPEFVPLFILRIPVYYYMRAPAHFRRWYQHRPPRWGEHWGHDWERRHSGWDRWERDSVPPPAPLPVYQREYSGDRYPRREQQQELRDRHYRYQPRDTIVRERIQPQLERRAPAPAQRNGHDESPLRSPRQSDPRYSTPTPLEKGRSVAPVAEPRKGVENRQRPAPAQGAPRENVPEMRERRSPPGEAQREREQLAPRSRDQGQGSRDRGVEAPQRVAPAQAPPPQRGPAVQEQRPRSGDTQREREKLTPGARGQEQKSREREDLREPTRGRWQERGD